MLVDIPDAETIKTRALLEQVPTSLNQDHRVRFYVSRGKGGPTVQCLRMMLSRVRNTLKAKGRRRKHFKMHADIFPYTMLNGKRLDCVIMRRSLPADIDVLETLEGLIAHGAAELA